MNEQSIFDELFTFFQAPGEEDRFCLSHNEKNKCLIFKQNHSEFLIKHNLFILKHVFSIEPNVSLFNFSILELLKIKIDSSNIWNEILFPILYEKLKTNEHMPFLKYYSWSYGTHLNTILLQKLYDTSFYSMLNNNDLHKMFLCFIDQIDYTNDEIIGLEQLVFVLQFPHFHENDKKQLMNKYLKNKLHFARFENNNIRKVFENELFKPYLTLYLKNRLLEIKCNPFNNTINIDDINYLIENGAQIISPKTNCLVNLVNAALINNNANQNISIVESLFFDWFENKNIVVTTKTLNKIDKLEAYYQTNKKASQYLSNIWNKFLLSKKLKTELPLHISRQNHKL